MSFYNTYRPSQLSDIDNAPIRKTISSLLSKTKEKLPHAYLFAGPRGTGKTTTARIVAKLFNCESPLPTGEPCGKCSMCQSITKGNAIDVIEIDAASNTGVDNIRDLKDKISLAPAQATWKIYIIDEVHMLSTGAFNALLKTLEEPPAHTAFILATTDVHKVPATIQSRCLLIPFQKPQPEEIVTALKRITTGEKITIDEDLLTQIALAADGSFRDAAKLLEQASLLSTKVTPEIIQQVLGQANNNEVTQFIAYLDAKDAAAIIVQLEQLLKEGIDIRSFFTDILRALQKRMINSIIGSVPIQVPLLDQKNNLDILHSYYTNVRNTNVPELTLQLAVLTICETQPLQPPRPTPQVSSTPNSVQTTSTMTEPKVEKTPSEATQPAPAHVKNDLQTLSLETLQEQWSHVIDEVKKINHATAGVLRSAKPQSIAGTTVVLHTSYAFHKDKLTEPISKDAIIQAIKLLFGEKVTLEIILTKK